VVRIRIRASSITPLTFPPCTYGCIAEPTQLFTTSLLRAASLCCIHIHTFTYIKYLTSHGTFELHGRGYMPSRRYGRSETCPPHVRLLHVATTVMGTGTAAHYTADDTGRDEVKSEHVPLPTGGIGRMPLVPLQGGRRSGRRPTAYGKVSCFSTRLVQRVVRGYLPVRRFALALHACFVSPPCCLWGDSPQQGSPHASCSQCSLRPLRAAAPRELGGCRRSEPSFRWSGRAGSRPCRRLA
jgi:hypothetical protein